MSNEQNGHVHIFKGFIINNSTKFGLFSPAIKLLHISSIFLPCSIIIISVIIFSWK